jgi:hypothetical protein
VLAKRCDYAFDEWAALTPEAKVELMLHYWDPQRPTIGERTRGAITDAFIDAYPSLINQALATTAYFSNWGWCIAVVVTDASVPVPRRFDMFPVVKGVGTGSGAAAFYSARWITRKRSGLHRPANKPLEPTGFSGRSTPG